jgi:hypothetical protein
VRPAFELTRAGYQRDWETDTKAHGAWAASNLDDRIIAHIVTPAALERPMAARLLSPKPRKKERAPTGLFLHRR